LFGEAGDDYIDGGAGDDIIDGQGGSDILIGGAGNDTIVYDSVDSTIDGGSNPMTDPVTDFVAASDTLIVNDELDLSNAATIAAISNIEVIELVDNARIVGGINPDDVISMPTAIDGDNTLMIESDGTPTIDTRVSIDIGSFDSDTPDTTTAAGYGIYSYTDTSSGDVTTLMVDIDIPIDMV